MKIRHTFIYHLLLFLLFPSLFLTCSEGCLQCTPDNRCLICDNFNMYFQVSFDCEYRNVDYCSLSFTFDQCAICYPGYSLDHNGHCTDFVPLSSKVLRCALYDQSSKCVFCEEGYFYDGSVRQCLVVDSPVEYCKYHGTNDTCAVCARGVLIQSGKCMVSVREDNCQSISMRRCSRCLHGHGVDLNSYIYHFSEISNSYFEFLTLRSQGHSTEFDVSVCEDTSTLSDCEVHSKSVNGICDICRQGFVFKDFTRTTCVPISSVSKLQSPSIENCYLMTNTVSIVNGQLYNLRLCEYCFNGYYKDGNGLTCPRHSVKIDRCNVYSRTKDATCLQCDQGYYTLGSVCVARRVDDNCLVFDQVTRTCKKCSSEDMVLYSNDMFCEKQLEQCKIHDTSSDRLLCQTCSSSSYQSNGHCIKLTILVDQCEVYSDEGVCHRCKEEYYLLSNSCSRRSVVAVGLSNCEESDPVSDTRCITCGPQKYKLTLRDFCQVPDLSLIPDLLQSKFYFCQRYTYSNGFKCNEFKGPVDLNGEDCDPYTKICSYYTSSDQASNVMTLVSPAIQHCIFYTPSTTSPTISVCSKCLEDALVDSVFSSDRTCGSIVISLCDDQKGLLVHGICVSLTYLTGQMTLSVKGSPSQNTEIHFFPSNMYCTQLTPTANCYYLNGSPKSDNYRCVATSTLINGQVICLQFSMSTCVNGIQIQLKYPVVLDTTSNKCVLVPPSPPSNNCLATLNGSCTVCATGHYSLPSLTLNYQSDIVSTTNFNDISQLNCLIYNSLTSKCHMCLVTLSDVYVYDTTSNSCKRCDLSANFYDPIQLMCISNNTYSSNLPNCREGYSNSQSLYACLSCILGYVPSVNTANRYTSTVYLKVNQISSLKSYSVSSFICNCVASSIAFNTNSSQNLFCGFTSSVSSVEYCQQCVFGYSGQTSTPQANVYSVNNCSVTITCDLNIQWIVPDPLLRLVFTCHRCSSSNSIPTLQGNIDISNDSNTILVQYNATDSITCSHSVASNVADCALQVTYFSTMVNATVFKCVACPPKYVPSFETLLKSDSTFQFVNSCTSIPYCLLSNVINQCEECEVGYFVDSSSTSCQPIASFVTSVTYCLTYTPGTALCTKCADQYVLVASSTTSLCILYKNTDCLHVIGSLCVLYRQYKDLGYTSTVLLGNSNVISQPTISCLPVPSTSSVNCLIWSNVGKCIKCKVGWFIGGGGTTCYQHSDANCSLYNNVTMKCKYCVHMYTLDSNSNCVSYIGPMIVNCSFQSGSICLKCIEGYSPVINSSRTSSICVDTSYFKLCQKINEELLFEQGILSCLTCVTFSNLLSDPSLRTILLQTDFVSLDDYSSHIDGKFTSLTSALGSQLLNLPLQSTVFEGGLDTCLHYETIPNCLSQEAKSRGDSFECIRCDSLYLLKQSQCVSTTLAEYIDFLQRNIQSDGPASKDIFDLIDLQSLNIHIPDHIQSVVSYLVNNCVKYSTNLECRSCDLGFYLQQKICITLSSTVSNCLVHSSSGICQECVEGYWNNYHSCVKITALGCKVNLGGSLCQVCLPSFDVFQGMMCSSSVANCLKFKNGKCVSCGKGMYLLSGTCVTVRFLVLNCLVHESEGKCLKCDDSFEVSQDGSICSPKPLPSDSKCLQYSNEPLCSTCLPNRYFNNGQCVPCLTDERSCHLCSPRDPYTCVMCRKGYEMRIYGQCTLNSKVASRVKTIIDQIVFEEQLLGIEL